MKDKEKKIVKMENIISMEKREREKDVQARKEKREWKKKRQGNNQVRTDNGGKKYITQKTKKK